MSIDTGPAPALAATRPSPTSTGYFTEAEIVELICSGEIADEITELSGEAAS